MVRENFSTVVSSVPKGLKRVMLKGLAYPDLANLVGEERIAIETDNASR
jgi:hypothetical protein